MSLDTGWFSSWSDSLIKSYSFPLQGRKKTVAMGHWDSAELLRAQV